MKEKTRKRRNKMKNEEKLLKDERKRKSRKNERGIEKKRRKCGMREEVKEEEGERMGNESR